VTTISEELSEYTDQLRLEQVPGNVQRSAKHLILDAVGIAFAASTFDFAHQTINALASFGAGDSDVIGMPVKLALRDAVLANGSLIHGLDFDDTHLQGVVHITSSCFPTALALAAQAGKSGADVLEAYIAGVETATRLGKVAQGELNQIGFHPTGLIAAFGCALIAGKIYALPQEQLTMAQGIVLSMASGAREYSSNSSGSKRLHPGWAGVSGITAAALARGGVTGPRTTYEGRFGLYATHLNPKMRAEDLARATADLGKRWETLHVAIKPFPAGQLHIVFIAGAIETAIKHDLHAEDIESIEALVPPHAVNIVCEPVAARKRPVDRYAAQFSLQYGVACGFIRRKFGLAELERYQDPALLALADRVTYRVDPNTGYPQHWSGEMNFHLKNGKTVKFRDEDTLGGADKPLNEDHIVAKFMGNAQLAMSQRRAEALRDQILNLDKLESARDLSRQLAAL
jgi:2-methylcitrate dehydratase PrpD